MVNSFTRTRTAPALFLAYFVAQLAFVVLGPTLPAVAHDFGVSVGTAGQLRTAAAVAGLATALLTIRYAARFDARELLVGGLSLIAVGSVVSASAPDLAVLVAGQVLIGAAATWILAGGVAAAAEWPPPEQRATVVALTVVGQPAAWVAGMPLVGALSEVDWRWSWLLVPAVALTAVAMLPRAPRSEPRHETSGPPGREAWARPDVRRWAIGELMAYAGWGGTLVYAGALFVESYGLGADSAGVLLGIAAAAYFPGAFIARRRIEGDLRQFLGGLALTLAAGSMAFGLVRSSAWTSTAIFAALVMVAGARGVAGSAFALHVAPEHKTSIGNIRSAAGQLGYLLGAAAGGAALAAGGYAAVELTFAGFFVAAALPHLLAFAPRRRVALPAC